MICLDRFIARYYPYAVEVVPKIKEQFEGFTIYENTLSFGKKTMVAAPAMYGGYEYAERQMIAFIPDALSYEWKFPILAVNIRPLNAKFADVLTHRDYLGSLMNLGVDRRRIGDIAVMDNYSACVFCEEKLAGYLSTELTRVKHTSVVCTVSDPEEISYTPKTEEIGGTVASVRLDSLIALAFHMSRSAVIPLIEGGRTFINGRLSTSNGARLKEGDIISVRGQGRFCLGALEGTTKKGRQFVRLRRYVS